MEPMEPQCKKRHNESEEMNNNASGPDIAPGTQSIHPGPLHKPNRRQSHNKSTNSHGTWQPPPWRRSPAHRSLPGRFMGKQRGALADKGLVEVGGLMFHHTG